MTALNKEQNIFKKSVWISIFFHLLLLIIIVLSPHFPKAASRKTTYYNVNLVSFPGGGGTGGAESMKEEVVDTSVPVHESLKDLTTPQEQNKSSTFRYPVEKPKKEIPSKVNKKTVIKKTEKTTPSKTSEKSSKKGSGLRIGVGNGTGEGIGPGSEFSSQIGISNFPFTYYIQRIQSIISSSWYKSRINPGIQGNFHTTIYFKIFRDGHISEPVIKERSGIRSLDLSAIRAVQSSRSSFPPLPREYREDYLGIILIFEHSQ